MSNGNGIVGMKMQLKSTQREERTISKESEGSERRERKQIGSM